LKKREGNNKGNVSPESTYENKQINTKIESLIMSLSLDVLSLKKINLKD
jgi:hypothetical protein